MGALGEHGGVERVNGGVGWMGNVECFKFEFGSDRDLVLEWVLDSGSR